MNPYRTARNQSLSALAATDQIIHLITEAALDSEAGLPVDKFALINTVTALQANANADVAAALDTLNSIA